MRIPRMTRRGFVHLMGAGAVVSLSTQVVSCANASSRSAHDGPTIKSGRRFHLCLSPDAVDADPDLLPTVQRAGVTTIWITGFLYGHWYYPPERIQNLRAHIQRLGMEAHVVNVPLGHPGDSLGAKSGKVPLTPPRHWRLAVRPDGSSFAGTSLHVPATAENAEALRRLQALGVKRVFLDDDFRLAPAPGQIGGCFCEQHRQEFLRRYGYPDKRWAELRDDVYQRSLTPLLRDWINFTCDGLTASFRAQQAAAPKTRLGIMVMYLGAEKAGIRLTDYRGVPLRVGEEHFNDRSFGSVKGKTDELFSALFHRRFVTPELAYSESTAYPAHQLSAAHLAAKFIVSLLSDVRQTMLMSGLTPFPHAHWETLAPAIKKQVNLHALIAGHRPRGPFKHYWGDHSRQAGDDQPNSLFLASGVPFEVTEEPASGGWTFLSPFDAAVAATGTLKSNGTTFVTNQDLPFALKHQLTSQIRDVPIVQEDVPVVCAWYPTACAALVWNLSEQRQVLTVKLNGTRQSVTVESLDVELVRL